MRTASKPALDKQAAPTSAAGQQPGQRHGRRRRRIPLGLLLMAVAAAIELTKPRKQRTWTGKFAGLVPYDLRRPTTARFKDRWWNVRDRHIIVPKAFGVGWTINFASLIRRMRHE